MKANNMQTGKLYMLDKKEGLESIFVWDHPYGGNRVTDQLPVEKPYMFLGSRLPVEKPFMFIGAAPIISVWCNILYDDKMGWIHLRSQSITEITENGS